MKEQKILLNYNYGFKWYSKENLYYKGYIFYKGEILNIDELESLLNSINSLLDFENLLKSFKGLFSIVFQKEATLYAAVDPTRTFPLFYHIQKQSILVTDNTFTDSFKDIVKDSNSSKQFLGMRYVLGKKTILNEVNQLQAGECVCFDGEINSMIYDSFSVGTNEIFKNVSLLKDMFENVIKNATQRLIKSASGRTIIVPLSGGYDSRLVVSLLYKEKYKNVICFTYGNKNNDEVQISKRVAEKLGYKWLLFETDKTYVTSDYLYDDEFKEFIKFSYNNTSLVVLQDYFFVREMKNKNLIPKDSIFAPGHSGDMLVGDYLYPSDIYIYNEREFTKQITKRHFVLKKYKSDKTIEKHLKKYYNKNKLSYSLIDNYNIKERQAKYVVNSVRNYEFFGYEHRMILWDQEISSFFRCLPFNLKLNAKFYKREIFELFFKELDIDFIPEAKRKRKKATLKKILLPYTPQVLINTLRETRSKPKNKFIGLPYKPLLDEMNKELGLNISDHFELLAEWIIKEQNDLIN
ncbi:asparagine synthase C-terminal domain-containing protein [Planktosalinus lacus]|uniref:asparagine synthase (glutamine-hydrolyzing) n=1 Tax=Planktosalinus lacus TaxID=1526573 RepID=A0A8J2YBQ8_9FLAO|nr:asparagine synthase C-terminal domain-containing protein [Planktosalinus lacus]GGE00611.1 asparagine synthase [Planktosalinus lacus]